MRHDDKLLSSSRGRTKKYRTLAAAVSGFRYIITRNGRGETHLTRWEFVLFVFRSPSPHTPRKDRFQTTRLLADTAAQICIMSNVRTHSSYYSSLWKNVFFLFSPRTRAGRVVKFFQDTSLTVVRHDRVHPWWWPNITGVRFPPSDCANTHRQGYSERTYRSFFLSLRYRCLTLVPVVSVRDTVNRIWNFRPDDDSGTFHVKTTSAILSPHYTHTHTHI